jgi:hypothetical protein
MNPQLKTIIRYVMTSEELSDLLLVGVLAIGILIGRGIEIAFKKKRFRKY